MQQETNKHWSMEWLRLITPLLIGLCLFMLNSSWSVVNDLRKTQIFIMERLTKIETILKLKDEHDE